MSRHKGGDGFSRQWTVQVSAEGGFIGYRSCGREVEAQAVLRAVGAWLLPARVVGPDGTVVDERPMRCEAPYHRLDCVGINCDDEAVRETSKRWALIRKD